MSWLDLKARGYVFEPSETSLALDLSQIVGFAPIYPLLYLTPAFLSSSSQLLSILHILNKPGQDD